MWSSHTRDQIRATAATYAATVTMPVPLTHCIWLGIEPASWHCRDVTDSFAPQRELLHSIFGVYGYYKITLRKGLHSYERSIQFLK